MSGITPLYALQQAIKHVEEQGEDLEHIDMNGIVMASKASFTNLRTLLKVIDTFGLNRTEVMAVAMKENSAAAKEFDESVESLLDSFKKSKETGRFS